MKYRKFDLKKDKDAVFDILNECGWVHNKKKDKTGYDYFTNEVSSKNIITLQVYYCKVFEGGNRDDQTCHLLATTNELKKIEDVHKELIKECKEQYIDKSKGLVIMENELMIARNKLYRDLKDICEKSFSIPNMDCEFVKIWIL